MSTTIGVDVAKSVFEVAVSNRPGRIVKRHRLSRGQFARFLATRAPATVVMEACGMAHFWGRQAVASGHRVVLLPPHAVRPYVPRNKTDRADATALLEAARNGPLDERTGAIVVKSVTQQALTGLHRLRSTWLATRTARIKLSAACSGSSASRSRLGRARSSPGSPHCSPAQMTLSPRCCTQRSPR